MKNSLRFEIFKRDGFTCVYCGRNPPSVILEVDHILPRSKKGTDKIENLATACFECNRGKRDKKLSEVAPSIKVSLARVKEGEAQMKEYRTFLRKKERQIVKDIEDIDDFFSSLTGNKKIFADSYKRTTIRTFLKNLSKQEIMEALDLAFSKFYHPENIDRTIKYFCGIAWNWIKKPETKRGWKKMEYE